MASIHKEALIAAAPTEVWAAIRDVGAVHRRLAPGFVTDTRMDGDDARIVTFANGMVVRELIVDVDDAARRLAYAAVGGRSTHHNASFEVFDEADGRARLLWTTDLLPDAAAPAVEGMMDGGLHAIAWAGAALGVLLLVLTLADRNLRTTGTRTLG